MNESLKFVQGNVRTFVISLFFLTLKPELVVLNLDEGQMGSIPTAEALEIVRRQG